MKDRAFAGAVVSGISRIAAVVGVCPAQAMNLLEAGRLPACLIDGVWIANTGLLTRAPRELPESMRKKVGRPRKYPLPKTAE